MDNNHFSEREKDVIRLLLQGKSNKQMALELGISSRTVEFHLGNIYAKLGVNSRSEAILKFTERQPRESTGGVQVKSTVDDLDGSTENGLNPTLRRISMKKLTYILAGLLAVILIAVIVIFEPSAQNSGPNPGVPIGRSTATNMTATLQPTPTVTARVPTQGLPTSLETDSPSSVVISPHTVNGYTAVIESYDVDVSHVTFLVRITGGEVSFGDEYFYGRIGNADLYDENGNMINTSGGWGPAVDPALVEFGFVPATLLKGDHFKGQFAFNLTEAPGYDQILARFHFDVDLPIYPEVRFYPKQTITANGLDMFLDSVTVTPTFTQIYLCFPPPSYAPWTIGNQAVLQVGEQEASLYNFRLLFDSSHGGDLTAGSEPYWIPPTKNGRCMKGGFPVGSSNPNSLTLIIPELENLLPYALPENPLLQLPTLYPGLSPKQAYYTYLEENGYTYKGPWEFKVQLKPY